MRNASRSMEKMGKKMQSAGKNMSTYLTAPILALGYVSVEAFDKQAKAIAQVEAGIKSTGMAAGYTSEQLQKMASDLQNKTIFGDEEILKDASAQLLTFTNIAGVQFERTQEAALNLATRLDGDLKSASIQLGKALNDPIANLSALSRSGIQFSTDQKAVIKALTESGRLADAQTIILDELEKQYGGAAEAAAKAGKGGLTQFYNIIGDIMEQFGEIVMEYLNPFVAKLKDLALRFQELDKSTKKIILAIAAFAAAIGPVLVVLGFLMTTVIPGLITLLPALGTAFTALTGPIGLVVAAVAAIGYMVYKHWDRIKAEMVNLQNYFIDLYNESVAFRVAIEGIILVFKTLWNIVKLVFGSIYEIVKNAGGYILDTFKNVGAGIKAALTGNFSALPGIMTRQLTLMKTGFTDTFSDIGGQIETFSENMKRDVGDAVDAVTKRKKIEFVKSNVDASAIQDAVAEAVNNGMKGQGATPVFAGVEDELEKAKREFAELEALITASGGNIASAIDNGQWETLSSKMSSAYETFKEVGTGIKEESISFKDNMVDVSEQLNKALEAGFGNAANFLGNFLGDLATGKAKAKDFFSGLLGVIASFMDTLGQALIAVGVASDAFKNAFASGFGAIAAGVALIALSKVVQSIFKKGPGGGGSDVPRFADGGLVYGPTLGLMGEYSGARSNPEVIAPLSKLKDLIGGAGPSGPIQLKGVLKGRDIHLQNARTDDFLNRRR